jgi:methylenetetrahydrofolate reductase (NADPH)
MEFNFKKAIDNKKFLITCELGPPKGPDTQELIDNAKALKGLVHAINITDGQGANMRMSPVVASYLVQQKAGLEAICQLVCRDRNRIGLQSDILGAAALGLNNFLALTGDKSVGGDHPEAKDVFDLSTDELVQIFKNFETATDFAKNKLNAPTQKFCVGAALHPGVPNLKMQTDRMKARIQNGVQFFQTQIVYEVEQLKRFLDSVQEVKAPVLIGITPLKSVKMANYMNEKVYGVSVPEAIIERLEKAIDPQNEGIKMALELINEVKKLGAGGVHVMAIGQDKLLPEIIKQAKHILETK